MPPRRHGRLEVKQDVNGRDLLGNGNLGVLLTCSRLRHVHQFVQKDGSQTGGVHNIIDRLPRVDARKSLNVRHG